MIILIDLDEVIADLQGELEKRWNAKFPHTHLFEGGVRKSFYIGDKDDSVMSEQVEKLLQEEGFFSSLKPIPGAIEAIHEMKALGHSVFIVTSAGVSFPNAATEKYIWVRDNLGVELLERLVITAAKPVIRGDILIDDRPQLAYEDKATWEHVLYDRSYNKDITGKRRITWDTWKEVLPELLP